MGTWISATVYALVNAVLSFFYQLHSDVKRERRNKKILAKMLNHSSYKWRYIRTLSLSIAESQQVTEQLLLDMGAERHEGGKPIWRWKGTH